LIYWRPLRNTIDLASFKAGKQTVQNTQYMADGEFVSGEIGKKILDLDEIPSPYLSGYFDKFLAAGLDPLIQFKRGCPFDCTYCGEGNKYFFRIGKASVDRVIEDLRYIATKAQKDTTLILADANFGMYRDDIELCRQIAQLKQEVQWPTRMNVSTGKNKPARIIEAIRILGGSLRVGGAVQSLDETVLKNIKRANISTDALVEQVQAVADLKLNSYAEVILGLPGETRTTHLSTIPQMMEAGFKKIQMYPLSVLPDAEMAHPDYQKQFGIQTKSRIIPRVFETYRFGTENFPSAEIVEMSMASDTLSFEDYLYCKQFQLSVELFYNDRYFEELFGLFEYLDLSIFDLILGCHSQLPDMPQNLRNVYDGFKQTVTEELWDSSEDLRDFINDEKKFKQYIQTEYKNSLATNRAIGALGCTETIHQIALKSAVQILDAAEISDPLYMTYVHEAIQFSSCRKTDVIFQQHPQEASFMFQWDEVLNNGFVGDPKRFLSGKGSIKLKFFHNQQQRDAISRRYNKHADPVLGMRNFIYHLYNQPITDYYRQVTRV
jgi:hypothetical protein